MGSLPPYVSRQLVAERLAMIFPDGTPSRLYCIRELAASTVFTALYIGAVEGADRYLGPIHVYRMTVEQAAKAEGVDREVYVEAIRERAPAWAITDFQAKHLSKSALARVSIMRAGAAGGTTGVLVNFPSGETRRLAPGPSSIIAGAVVEVVATDGAITPRRQAAIHAVTDCAGFSRSQVAFVTAYQDRASAGFRKTVTRLAWDSFAWFVSEPENIIILHGGRSSPQRLAQLLADRR